MTELILHTAWNVQPNGQKRQKRQKRHGIGCSDAEQHP